MSPLRAIEFKVGAMVVVIGGLIAFMSMQISDSPSMFSKTQKAWFLVPSAAGLIKNSAVKSAGIPVGVIDDIRLQDGQARIDISIKADVPLTSSAAVQMMSNGILGDKYIEIYPGSVGDPPLEKGSQILTVQDKGSLDGVIGKVGTIADDLKSVSNALKEAVSDDGTRKHVLGRIMKNIEVLSGDLAQMTTANKDKIGDIVDQVQDVTATLDDLINDQSDTGFKQTWKKTMVRIDSTLKNVDEIASKINKGEGTVGKLINDPETVEGLNTAIEGVNSLFDVAGHLQMGFDFHADYLGSVDATKSYIGLRIQPGLDRFYEIGIIDDPAGLVDHSKTVTAVNGGPETSEKSTTTYYDKTKLTLLFGKNFWDWTIKGGLIESSGGVGLDYYTLAHKLRLSIEAFDLSKTNLRASIKYDLKYGFYLNAGYNDILDKNDVRSAYLGVGLFLTNDDLRLLLASKGAL